MRDNSAIDLRRMRATDMVKHSRYTLPQFAGFVAIENGRKVGAAAIVWGDGNRPFLCLEIEDDSAARRHRFFLHRLAKDMVRLGISVCGELFTLESAAEPTAPAWLARLGFRPTGQLLGGERVLVTHG